MIEAILVANRGEIACRIVGTCRSLGIRSVAIYSEADAKSRHVAMADEAILVGPAPSSESYLAIAKIIAAAQRSQVDAIHPGFGFLAENAEFAGACRAAGLLFIGPEPEAIAATGDKRTAKRLVVEAGIPVVPGYFGDDQSDHGFQSEADLLGYPVLVKAAAGGGGRGMRLVTAPSHLPEALAAARREALHSFASDALILEKPLVQPRHIEFQVFGDRHGNVIHLGERECSIQRRHQKVIEESPSPALSADLRRHMGETAVAVAQAINYSSAGTVEFLLDREGNFYFLEMNTRLQVEHPVTEMVTGLDLVAWQIRVAEGERLPLAQDDMVSEGHAIEVRLYAEDPANGFLPTSGRIRLWREPVGEGIRVDSGIRSGDDVSVHYDPMLAKIIAFGGHRDAALRRLRYALENTRLLGVTSNLQFLLDIVRHPAFHKGELSTAFIPEHFHGWRPPDEDQRAMLLAVTVARHLSQHQPGAAGFWRNNPNRLQRFHFRLSDDGEPLELELAPKMGYDAAFEVTFAGDTSRVEAIEWEEGCWVLEIDGHRRRFDVVVEGDAWWVQTGGASLAIKAASLLPEPRSVAGAMGSLRAPMPGSVLEVLVEVGQTVEKGQPLMKLEAMKMEHTIRAAGPGIIEAIYYLPGDTVDADVRLLAITDL